jgi:hypothetical protein
MKGGVWGAISARRIMGPCFFFHETTNSEHYVREGVSPILDQQNNDKSYRHIMQDNAMVHSAKDFIGASDVFGKPDISPRLASMITHF